VAVRRKEELIMESNLTTLVSRIGRGNPEVTGALVVDGGGRVLASEGAAPEVVRAAVALMVPLRDFLDRTAAELGCGELRGALIEGASASLALADVDGDRTAVVIGASGAAPGALRADSLWLADELRRAGGGA
jgi:predicted regulator of Ras-like GTPase activity (Roadblock/LC7/MglB family)